MAGVESTEFFLLGATMRSYQLDCEQTGSKLKLQLLLQKPGLQSLCVQSLVTGRQEKKKSSVFYFQTVLIVFSHVELECFLIVTQ